MPLSENLVAVQWGLLGMFGVVVGLLIPPTERYRQQFLEFGNEEYQKIANRWVTSVRMTAILVGFALLGLSLLGVRDVGFESILSTETWILLTPLLAQVGIIILVFVLLHYVKPVTKLCLEQPAKMHATPGGLHEPTLIRFINETSEKLQIYWINFDGELDPQDSASLYGGGERNSHTYPGHRFLIRTSDDRNIGTVTAISTPGIVVISPEALEKISDHNP